MAKITDRAYIENYPELKTWLNKHNAICQQQVQYGDLGNPSYLELWRIQDKSFVVQVYPNKIGWNIFTDFDANEIEATLVDAENRLGLR